MMPFSKAFKLEEALVSIAFLKKLAFAIGTIKNVSIMPKVKKSSYGMDSDFGIVKDKKKICGQLVCNHEIPEKLHKQVIGLINLPPIKIAGLKSQYLTRFFR